MDKRKLEKIESDADLEQEARNRPAEPVVTDLNDEPAADAVVTLTMSVRTKTRPYQVRPNVCHKCFRHTNASRGAGLS